MHRRRLSPRRAIRVAVSVAISIFCLFAALSLWESRHPRRPDVLAVIGVMTAFDVPQKNYGQRRQLLRQTWFPADKVAQRRVQRNSGLVVRFVLGRASSQIAEARISQEEKLYGKFFRLEMAEHYQRFYHKTQEFWRIAWRSYNAQYIIKVDDDKYVRLDRLPAAISTWQSMRADYIGCFSLGHNYDNPLFKWYDPNHNVYGQGPYAPTFKYADGPFYALSGRVVRGLVKSDLEFRISGSIEDYGTAAILQAFNVERYDDRRLCDSSCSFSTVAVNLDPNNDGNVYCVSNDSLSPNGQFESCLTAVDARCGSSASSTFDSSGALPIVKPFHDLHTDFRWIESIVPRQS